MREREWRKGKQDGSPVRGGGGGLGHPKVGVSAMTLKTMAPGGLETKCRHAVARCYHIPALSPLFPNKGTLTLFQCKQCNCFKQCS